VLKYLLLLAILPILLVSISSQDSFSQNSNVAITVTTDKSFYPVDSTMTISGEVRDFYSETPVTISINAPNGNLVVISPVSVNDDKTFSMEYTLGGSLMKAQGVHIVTAQYGSENIIAVTYFDYITHSNYLTITTDKPSYTAGETIHISGEFNNLQNGTSLNISLQSPEGNYSTISNITTNNNTYSKSINTQYDSSISTPGSYTLTSHYGTNTASTTFDYSSTPTQQDNEYFIPDSSYLTLSDHEIDKWNGELTKWQNAQNRTDSKIEFYYEKLATAITRNQTDKIETYTERIGHSMALSELYDGLIECLQEQLELYS